MNTKIFCDIAELDQIKKFNKKEIGKQIKLTEESIEKLINEMKLEVRGDTIVLPEIDKANKKKERELNKLFRIKKRLYKEFSGNPLIEIKISTN